MESSDYMLLEYPSSRLSGLTREAQAGGN